MKIKEPLMMSSHSDSINFFIQFFSNGIRLTYFRIRLTSKEEKRNPAVMFIVLIPT